MTTESVATSGCCPSKLAGVTTPLEGVPAGGQHSEVTLSAEDIETLRVRARGDLYFFAVGILGFDRLHPRIHKPLCRLLELYGPYDELHLIQPWHHYRRAIELALMKMRVPRDQWEKRVAKYRREGIKKLMLLMPRTWYKTTLGSIAYSVWMGIRDPNYRELLAQNTSTNAVAKGSAIGQCFLSNPLMKLLFPELLPTAAEKWSAEGRCLHRTKTFAESTYEFAGIRTQVTSRHFDCVIEDDTVAPDKDDLGADSILPSQDDVSQAIGWHRLVPPLMDELTRGRNIITGTRWFVLDLIKWVKDNEPDFLIFQWAVKEDSSGQPNIHGHLVWPERFTEDVIKQLQNSLGPYLFNCLYMNSPVAPESQLFRPDWIRYYDKEPLGLMTFTTVDLGGDPTDTKSAPDYNVVMTCGKDMTEGKIYVLDYSRERCSPSRTLELIFDHVERWHPVTVGVETVGYQKSLRHWIRQRQVSESKFFSVTELTHNKRSKTQRIMGLQPAVSGGVLYFRPHMTALVNELLIYPLGANDDLADALAMQLELWRVSPSLREEAQRATGGPNDATTQIELARKAQKEADERKARRVNVPRARWGAAGTRLAGDGRKRMGWA